MLLRNDVVGPERFDAAFREYIRRWAYKHPQPADFFRTIEDVTGEDLDWFWRGWFYETGQFDQALTGLEIEVDLADGMGAGRGIATVENRGEIVLPTAVEFTFSDGSRQTVVIPAEAYFSSDTAGASVPLRGRTLVSARINASGDYPDQDPTDDARDL